MLDIAEFNAKAEAVLSKQLDITVENIKQNMVNNNQIATGRTIDSLKKGVSGTYGYIEGSEHIDTLETGISPQRSQMESWQQTWIGMLTWYKAKGFTFQEYPRRAARAATNQRQIGSVLFRQLQGGRRGNVYTNEIDPLAERIKEEIAEVIVNTKIL